MGVVNLILPDAFDVLETCGWGLVRTMPWGCDGLVMASYMNQTCTIWSSLCVAYSGF